MWFGVDRSYHMGAATEWAVLSHPHGCCGGPDNYPGDPVTDPTYANWRAFITNAANDWFWLGTPENGYTVADPVRQNYVQFEFWNEPDNTGFWNPSGSGADYQTLAERNQFLETYRQAYVALRSILPSAKIAGPNYAAFDCGTGTGPCAAGGYVYEFLKFARDNNVLPNIFGWHEILLPGPCCDHSYPQQPYVGPDFIARVDRVRQTMDSLGIPRIPIEIDEWGPWSYYGKPATWIVSYANFQRAGILQAAKACWNDATSGLSMCGTWNTNSPPNSVLMGNLDGLLTLVNTNASDPANFQKRSAWWAVKGYADLVGRYRTVHADSNFDGMAAYDSATGQVRVVLGNVGGGSSTTLKLYNMDAVTTKTSALVHVERIANSEDAPGSPSALPDVTLSITGGLLQIPISGSAQWDAYTITVTPQ